MDIIQEAKAIIKLYKHDTKEWWFCGCKDCGYKSSTELFSKNPFSGEMMCPKCESENLSEDYEIYPNTLNDMCDLISRLVDRLEWKPIESAPKDGTSILICGGTVAWEGMFGEDEFPMNGVQTASWYNDHWKGGYDNDGRYNYYKPKYWMRLPLPPVGDKQK